MVAHKLEPFRSNTFKVWVRIRVTLWVVPTQHVLHIQTTAGGKLKLKELLSSESFAQSIRAHGGRASEKVLRAEAGKLGFGGDAATADLFWRANARIRGEENGHSDSKWRAFPLYMQRLAAISNVYARTWLDGQGVFKGVFVLMHAEMSTRHTTWRQQDHLNATRNLVPHGLKIFLKRSSDAKSLTWAMVA